MNVPPITGRRGFTLIELLVSIAIMAVIAAITIPAIQSARMSAQAVRCRNNLAQLGAAFHAYHLAQGVLPPGTVDLRSPAVPGADRFVWGWALQLLPYLGESNRYLQLDSREGVMFAANAKILAGRPTRLTCPASSGHAASGYAGCYDHNSGEIRESGSGVLTLNVRVRYSDLPDGLHNSILLGEALDIRWAEGSFGSLRSIGETWGEPGISTTHPRSTNARLESVRKRIRLQSEALEKARAEQIVQSQSDYPPAPPMDEPLTETTPSADSEETVVEEVMPEDEPTESEGFPDDNPEKIAYTPLPGLDGDELSTGTGGDSDRPPPPPQSLQLARSRAFEFWPTHAAGGHFLMVDGSVRNISRSVDIQVLRRLANRRDMQDPGAF